MLDPECTVSRTDWLPGSTFGQRCVRSPGFIFVIGIGVPPAEETRASGPAGLDANTIFPSSPQLAPRIDVASQSVTAAPPSTEIFFTLPSDVNPSHCPSGEKNGE